MDNVKIIVLGGVNTGKSTLARLIAKALNEYGIEYNISEKEKEEGYPEENFEAVVKSLQNKTKVLIDTEQLNKNAVIE